MKKVFSTSQHGFSIIEVMIGIFVFSLGLISIYALLASSLNVNSYNRNAIVASQLAREQIEFIYNLRDSNYENLRVWNYVFPWKNFVEWNYYKASQNGAYEIVMDNITPSSGTFPEWKNRLSEMWDMPNGWYRVCLNGNVYEYCPNSLGWVVETEYYKYLFVEQATDEFWNAIPNAFLLTSKVIWYKRWYFEYEIKTVITDWRRI